MPDGVFITATDTGVGKTLISASLAWKLSQRDENICVMKPFATSHKVFSNKFNSKDLYLLSKSINLIEDQRYLNPYFYSVAASPYMASKILKVKPPSITTALDKFSYLRKKYNFVIVEGIGGVMVPINQKYSLVDFIRLTRLPVIIVTRPIIGTINHTLLTIHKCKEHNIPIKGIIFNKMPEKPDIVMESTPSFIERLTKIPVLGTIPHYKRLKYNASTFKKISDKIRYAI
ncbi:MAG TPA: dethiobiotin synthase [Phototrophicaceae bacterium]|nr:dethiobiotin synthase [Phototrophicaceae bacterium]